MSATFQPNQAHHFGDDRGVVIPLEGRLRRFEPRSFAELQAEGGPAVALDLVRRVLALPEAQRTQLMAFLHLASDAEVVTGGLNLPASGGVELWLKAPAALEA